MASSVSEYAANTDPGVGDDDEDDEARGFTAKSIDNLRLAFAEFDEEGFGEIPVRKLPLLLQSKELQTTPRRWQRYRVRQRNYVEPEEETLTFQAFIDVVSRKRSQSFKCAIHSRDHQVYAGKHARDRRRERLSQDLESCFTQQQGRQGSTNLLRHDKNSDPFKSCASVRQCELQPSKVKCWLSDVFLSDPLDREDFLNNLGVSWAAPTFFIALSTAQVIIYALPRVFTAMTPLDLERHLFAESCKRTEIWRFLSYSLVHDHVIHLTFDLAAQLTLGSVLEMTHGTPRAMTLHLTAIVCGSLAATSVKYPRHPPLVNATAGSIALLASYLTYFVSSSSEIAARDWVKIVLLLGALSVHLGYVIKQWFQHEEKDFYADVAGVIVGVTVGVVILKSFGQNVWTKRSWWTAAGLVILMAGYLAIRIAMQSDQSCFQIRRVETTT